DAEALALRAHAPCRVVTYGFSDDADWHISHSADDGRRQRFGIERDGAAAASVRLTFPGKHNAANATAALILAVEAGAAEDVAIKACADFRGPARRFEVLGDAAGVTVVDDYAHHPTEVAAALAAARQRFGSRRLLAVHTPHTYSRTRTLLESYRDSFSDADVAVIGPIEEARERGQPRSVSSEEVAARVAPTHDVHVVASSDEAIAVLARLARDGDVIVVLSLGGFDKLAPRLLGALSQAGAHV
ncbi:MAG: glutamate ligase domain-containing protein, partial [Candidatus Dormibacteria bacterium]